MSLYWPATVAEIDLTHPGTHAFVIGVGDYPHLIGGGGNPAVATFGLQQLTTTRLTAKRVAEWLAANHNNPEAPLASVELLVSPSLTLSRPDGSQVSVERATMANVKAAFSEWWARCNANSGNTALFYFAGHGLSTASQFLLLEDFGAPGPNLWENCLDFAGMRLGMRKNVADTQLFFVDACRESPIDALTQLNPQGAALCAADIFDNVASTGVYFAAAEGRQAYGPPDDVTFFCTALLESLDGAGALGRAGAWAVDTFSLSNALGQIISRLVVEGAQPLTCNPSPSGTTAVIHCPAHATVRTTISCRTPAANAEATIRLLRGPQAHTSNPGEPRPWRGRVQPGEWDIEVDFQSFSEFRHREALFPPVFDLEVPS